MVQTLIKLENRISRSVSAHFFQPSVICYFIEPSGVIWSAPPETKLFSPDISERSLYSTISIMSLCNVMTDATVYSCSCFRIQLLDWSCLSGETLTVSKRRTVGAWFSPDGEALLQVLVDGGSKGEREFSALAMGLLRVARRLP